MARVLAVCGGFLLAILWMDLMFDVQVVGHEASVLPEEVLASIAAYYRRVTTDAFPMGHLIGVVMLATVVGCVWQLFRGAAPRWARALALALALASVGLAQARIFPDAVRLGARSDVLAAQSELARGIFEAHVACFAAILVFTGLQLATPQRRRPADSRRPAAVEAGSGVS
jgi:hypothetical protein